MSTGYLRLTKDAPSKTKGEKPDNLFNKIGLWLKRNNINMDLEEFIILNFNPILNNHNNRCD